MSHLTNLTNQTTIETTPKVTKAITKTKKQINIFQKKIKKPQKTNQSTQTIPKSTTAKIKTPKKLDSGVYQPWKPRS